MIGSKPEDWTPRNLSRNAPVAAVADVIADVIDVGERQHDEIVTLAIAVGATGGAGLLVVALPWMIEVKRLLGVFAHAFPDAHHVAAGGVDDLAALLDLFQGRQLGAKGGDDHHIVGCSWRRALVGIGFMMPIARSAVHLGIVDDFAEMKTAVLENLARGVGEIDGALHAVAEAELLGEPDGQYPSEVAAGARIASTISLW